MLKTVRNAPDLSGYSGRLQLQHYLDPARALGRQVISGEVAAGIVVAPDEDIEIGQLETAVQESGQQVELKGESPRARLLP